MADIIAMIGIVLVCYVGSALLLDLILNDKE